MTTIELGLDEALHLGWIGEGESWVCFESDEDVVRVDVDVTYFGQG